MLRLGQKRSSGLVAALAALTTAPTVKAATTSAQAEHPIARVRRLAKELSDAMNDWSETFGPHWRAVVYPAAGTAHPIYFEQPEALARAAVTVTPVMALFREWHEAREATGEAYISDEEIDQRLKVSNRLEREIAAAPILYPTDLAAKVLAITGYGDFALDDFRAGIVADARALVEGA